MKITIISSSVRTESVSYRVALHLQQQLVESDHESTIIDLRNHTFPLLNQMYSEMENPSQEQQQFALAMENADAIIFVTPEYNGGYSPALKNAIDHFPKSAYARKAIGIVTSSTGAMGGMRVSQQMQLLTCALFAIPSPHMLITPFADKKFDEKGNLLDETFKRNVDHFLKEFFWLAEALTSGK
jgi:chromate reductase